MSLKENDYRGGMSNFISYILIYIDLKSYRGCLVKKGKVRWFELCDDQLKWFDNSSYTSMCNYLSLYNCLVTASSKTTIVIATPGTKNYSIQVRDEVEQKDWIKDLQSAVMTANRINDIGFEKRGDHLFSIQNIIQ